ncbi:MAG: phosphatidate cytidylyltransferase [Planctomycetes bacterium]|nr:phosphatidate cytidylyltransferase [Planctomycetota bacterium]
MKSTLAKRVFFGTLLIVFFTGLFLLDGYLSARAAQQSLPAWLTGLCFAFLCALLSATGGVELARLARTRQINIILFPAIIAIIVVATHPFWSRNLTDSFSTALAAALITGLFFSALIQALKSGNSGTINNLAGTSFAIIYLGIGYWFIFQIRLLDPLSGTIWGQIGPLIMFIACVKSSDIGAYFTGRFIGRHKWVPTISPAKTWEGFFGGIVFAVIVASIFAQFSNIIDIKLAWLFGGIMALTGQLGDLLESMLKRDADIKDSAHLIPEFGGVLDLIDSVVAAAPFALLFLVNWGKGG